MRLHHFSVLAVPLLWGVISPSTPARAPGKSLPNAAGPGVRQAMDGVEWITRPPDNTFTADTTREIAEGDYYEVVTSKKDVAIFRDLSARSFAKITPDLAGYFTGAYYRCPEGKTPYLIRAVYGHGGTGRYSVKREGRKILVEHGSLGRSGAANRSALVLNLDFEPEAAYTVVHIAE